MALLVCNIRTKAFADNAMPRWSKLAIHCLFDPTRRGLREACVCVCVCVCVLEREGGERESE